MSDKKTKTCHLVVERMRDKLPYMDVSESEVGPSLAPDEDYYPTTAPTYSDETEMSFTEKPEVAPYAIVREMTNTPSTPHEDFKANAYMKAQLKRGKAKKGYYYVNVGEDAGSISATVPNGYHLARVKCKD